MYHTSFNLASDSLRLRVITESRNCTSLETKGRIKWQIYCTQNTSLVCIASCTSILSLYSNLFKSNISTFLVNSSILFFKLAVSSSFCRSRCFTLRLSTCFHRSWERKAFLGYCAWQIKTSLGVTSNVDRLCFSSTSTSSSWTLYISLDLSLSVDIDTLDRSCTSLSSALSNVTISFLYILR